METKKAPKGQEYKRLTLRMSEELEQKIREETKEIGTNVNQTLVYILNKGIINI